MAVDKIDVTQPANVRLTRQQKQVLKYVRENQGATIPDVAHAVGCRPYYAMRALEALERFRWVATGGRAGSCYGWRWELSEQARTNAIEELRTASKMLIESES